MIDNHIFRVLAMEIQIFLLVLPSSLQFFSWAELALFSLLPAYGLHKIAYGLANIEYGLNNIAYERHNIAYGLHNISSPGKVKFARIGLVIPSLN